jgi:hypothetical protein
VQELRNESLHVILPQVVVMSRSAATKPSRKALNARET